jgi:hypothetical protein
MTYRQLYQNHLENCMSRGGTPKQMEKTVKEFNSLENQFYSPTEMFKEWVLTDLQHLCTTCSRIFTLKEEPIDLDEEVTCQTCKGITHG